MYLFLFSGAMWKDPEGTNGRTGLIATWTSLRSEGSAKESCLQSMIAHHIDLTLRFAVLIICTEETKTWKIEKGKCIVRSILGIVIQSPVRRL